MKLGSLLVQNDQKLQLADIFYLRGLSVLVIPKGVKSKTSFIRSLEISFYHLIVPVLNVSIDIDVGSAIPIAYDS